MDISYYFLSTYKVLDLINTYIRHNKKINQCLNINGFQVRNKWL
jgi:hypothetical protein